MAQLRLAANKYSDQAIANDEVRADIVQPHVRTYTIWSPTLIRAAEISADTGYLRLLANLCDWIIGDDRVMGCLDARVQALFGLDPTFERSGDKRRSGRAIRALEADEDWWDSYPEAESSLIVKWGIIAGLAPGLHHWQAGGPTHGDRLLAKPEFWHPQHVRWDWMTRRWMTRIGKGVGGYWGATEVELVPGDGQWILHRPYGKDRPWAMGLWRGLARLVLLKSYANDDWARLGETAARTVITSEKDVKDNKDKRQELANDIMNCGRDGTIVLPPGFDMKVVEVSAATKDIYDQQIKMANEAIAVLIRGGNLSTVVKGGSRAAAESQKETGDDAKLRFDAQAFTTTIHDESLTWWSQYNFGDAGLAPWPVYPVEQKEDLKSKADTMMSAAQALQVFQTLGFDIDREAFAQEFDFDDFLLVPKGEPSIAPKPEPPPAAPTGQQGQGQGQQGQQQPPANPPNPPPPAPAKAMMQAVHAAALDENGQAYADKIAENMAAQGAKAISPTVAAMLAAVAKAESFEEAQALIVKAYGRQRSPVELAALTEAALVMAQLGGAFEVHESIQKDE